jgi:hypothetical protein
VNSPPKKENVQTDVKIDEVTQSDADLAKAAAEWKQSKDQKAANATVKANATDFTDAKPFPDPTFVPLKDGVKGNVPVKKGEAPAAAAAEPAAAAKAQANVTTVAVKTANVTSNATAKVQVKANATDFTDPKPFPDP